MSQLPLLKRMHGRRHKNGCPLLPKLDGASPTGCCTSCRSGVGTSTGISSTMSSSSAWGTWNLNSWHFCWSSATYTAAGSSTSSVFKDGQLRERGNEGSEDSSMKVLRYTNVTIAPETKGVCHNVFDCAYPWSQNCWLNVTKILKNEWITHKEPSPSFLWIQTRADPFSVPSRSQRTVFFSLFMLLEEPWNITIW